MTNAPFPSIDDFWDIESVNHYHDAVALGQKPEVVLAALRARGRDNARTPMQWDAGPHAGFTTGKPWLAVNPNHALVNAEAAVADDHSVFHHYRRLIELRHTLPVVAYGDFHMLLPDNPHVYAFTRTLGEERLLVLANFTGREVAAPVPEEDQWAATELLLGNLEPDIEPPAGPELVLAPWEARIYRTYLNRP